MKKSMSVLLAAAMCSAMLAGCGSTAADTAADASAETTAAAATEAADSSASAEGVNVFKIGGTSPLTGAAAIYGNAVKNGAQIAVDEINESVVSVQFELKYEDDENDPEKAVSAYNALKDWGMQISLASVTTKPCEATSTEHFADRIFGLTPSASSTAITEGKDNVFQMCFADPNQGLASADYIADQKLGTKVAVIYRNDDVYSSGIYEKFKTEADVKGLEIVSATTFTDASSNDFSVQLTEAKNAGADLLFLPIYYQPASLILSQANAMGYAPTFFGVDGMDGILDMPGFDTTLAEGLVLMTPFCATVESSKSFVDAYTAAYGTTPNQFAADAYDGVYIVKAALEQAGCTADMSNEEICDALVSAITSLKFTGLTGTDMSWNAEGQVSKAPTAYVVKDGQYVEG